MASIQKRGDKYQLRVVHALLPRPFFSTFDTREDAQAYAAQLEALLCRGVVPAELLQAEKRGSNPTLTKIIADYLTVANVAASDRPMLRQIDASVGLVRLQSIDATWADLWVYRLKVERNLAPGTVRKHVGALARVLDWHWRRMGETVANPLRSMPRGYAQATEAEAALLKSAGLAVRRDVVRDRRLSGDEAARIRAVLAGHKRPDRERAWGMDAELSLLFELILSTGLRLIEAYRLRADQVDLQRWVLRVDGSKGHRGAAKPRVVPLVPEMRQPLATHCAGRVGLVFGFWDGSPEDVPRCTSRLSKRFASLFDYAGVDDFTEHDLRHEATCRWFEMRRPDGAWVFSDVEIARIMGWRDLRMALRYASLRGEDLSARLG